MIKKLAAAAAVMTLLTGAVAFTQIFVTHAALAGELAQVQMKVDLRFLDQRKDTLFDRQLQLKTLMLEQPQHREEIIRELNQVEAERESVDKQILNLLRGGDDG